MRVGDLEYNTTPDGFLIKRKGRGLIKMHEDKDGYFKYHLCQGSGTYNIFVHQVIWLFHNGEIPNGMTIDHINGDKQDNRIENLQLLTAKENAIKGNARWWKVVDPEGHIFIVYNLAEFCRGHNLNASHMREVAKGYKNVKQHKGYQCHECHDFY